MALTLPALRWALGGPKTAMAAALVLPWAPWWAAPAVGVILLLTWSWLAFLAVAVGAAVQWPAVIGLECLLAVVIGALWWWSPTVGGRPLLQWTPRGDRNSTIWGRWYGIQLAALRLTWFGRGRGSMRRDLRRWHSRGVRGLPTDALFCEPVQLCYEYGLLGFFAMVLAGLLLWPTLAWDIRWAATVATFAVLTCGHAPVFYARRWVTRQLRRLIAEPPLLADLTIHVCHDGTFKLYQEADAGAPLTTQGWAVVSAAMLRAGVYVANEHGLTPQQIGLEP